jgi:hypothetical protein
MAEELYRPKAIKPPTTSIEKNTRAGKELPFLISKTSVRDKLDWVTYDRGG